jgi:hypothetical protein
VADVTRPHFAGIATANTGDQLDTKLWRELSLWWQRAINKHWFQWTATRFYQVDHKDTWGMDALKWSEHKPDAFGGLHNGGAGRRDRRRGLGRRRRDLRCDRFDDDRRGLVRVRVRQPYRKRGRFYELFTRFAHRWLNAHGRLPRRQGAQPGEDPGRHRGLGPRQRLHSRQRAGRVPAAGRRHAHSAAADRGRKYPQGRGLRALSAGVGPGRCPLRRRPHVRSVPAPAPQGREVESWRGLDTMQTAGRVKLAYDECADDKPTATSSST